MPEYRFYQLGKSTLSQALLGILPKALERGMRANILCASAERMADLNNRLWTDDPNSFLPHGTAAEGEAAQQPILLSVEDKKPANDAQLLMLTDGADTVNPDLYELICVMLDGGDEAALSAGRAIWSRAKTASEKASYWVQTDRGGWEEKTAQ